MSADMQWDLAKSAFQLLGALLIARLTVGWALSRFKYEKAWERQSEALANVVAALAEMRRVNDKWTDEAYLGRDFAEEFSKALQLRYQDAKREFERVAAVGVLVLPAEIADILLKLEADLDGGTYDSWQEELDSRGAAIGSSLGRLVTVGQRHLRPPK
ncbi:MAG: hypothetical protein E5W70_05915 [Mesorhizobium sp.]|uniref:hypothetical protein n=1 Tax=Mesorhizobium sp. TaxID=1871066 RepID=UPI00120A1E61|nr:hypothetical protein [Mesorhizobium sp.]TIT23911.1 MAG: hypothetical protein E5W70_05915 [Mesorhizobium sp.]